MVNLLDNAGIDLCFAEMPHASKLETGIRAVFAEEEGRAISEGTKAALAAAKARGVKLGNCAIRLTNTTAAPSGAVDAVVCAPTYLLPYGCRTRPMNRLRFSLIVSRQNAHKACPASGRGDGRLPEDRRGDRHV